MQDSFGKNASIKKIATQTAYKKIKILRMVR
jgi:hypothetical protein